MVDVFSNSLKFPTGSGVIGGINNLALKEFWVSPQGSDTTGDGSVHNPWKTLVYALWRARNTSKGELSQVGINMHPGLYAETQTLNIPSFVHVAGSNADKRMTLLTSTQDLVIHMSGQSSISDILVGYAVTNVGTTGLMVSDVQGTVDRVSRINNVGIRRCDTGVYLGFSGVLEVGANSIITENNTDLEVGDLTAYVDFLGGARTDRTTHVYPSGFEQDHGLFVNPDLDPSSDQVQFASEISLGRPDKGREAALGEGDAYTVGMVILTTDNTTSATSDGANFADATSSGVSQLDDLHVEFQGSTSGYAIMFGSNLPSAPKHWGISSRQATAMTATTKDAIQFEVWNGSAWIDLGVMAVEQDLAYVYGNDVLLRANSKEHIRYGIDDNNSWVRKSIGGKNLYWSRMRIITDQITQAPTFSQFKLSSSRTEIASDGYTVHHGTARYIDTLLSAGNIFGETGGVVGADVAVGSGASPSSWTHNMPNSLLNQTGDAVYLQTFIPFGVDTSFPAQLSVLYSALTAGASTSGVITTSVALLDVEGVHIADPSGGIVPIRRQIQDVSPLDSRAAQSQVSSIPIESTKIRSVLTSGIDICNQYPGDAVLVRVELTDDGSGNKDIIIWGVELSFPHWANGIRI